MSPKFTPSTAREVELAIRILALLCAALGAPVLALAATATGHPLFALGSIAASGPLAVARLIAPPESPTAASVGQPQEKQLPELGGAGERECDRGARG